MLKVMAKMLQTSQFPNSPLRCENDSLGEVELPKTALYGAQTQRALNLYPTNGQKTLGDYPVLVDAMLLVKAVAARTNGEMGELPVELTEQITAVCQSLRQTFEASYYPINPLHGGGGISANMNVSEVIANCVNQRYHHGELGSYTPTHPNDHLNYNLSTSDTLFTASAMAIYTTLTTLLIVVQAMQDTMTDLQSHHQGQQKISRTCLQDAVAIDFNDFWSGWTASLNQYQQQLEQCQKTFLHVNLGANIIGREGDSSPEFSARAIALLAKYSGEAYQRHPNFFQCSQSHDDAYLLASTLETFSHWLIKIGKDLRLMASGPQTGLREITLPQVQPGSSAMPGKINPTIPEYLIQSAMQAIGHLQTVHLTQTHAELDYTPWGLVTVTNMLDAMQRLTDGIDCFSQYALSGINVNVAVNNDNVHSLVPTIIDLKKYLGYSKTSALVKSTNGDLQQLTETLNQLKQTGAQK